ncbi:MAG: BMP family protein [Anaerolineales bacterium]
MQHRIRILIVVTLALGLALAAFGGPAAAQDDEFRVAVVTPSATDDLAFSQSIIDALDILAEEVDGFSYDVQDGTFVVDDAAVALRDWASSGEYDLIIAHGSQYGSILEELAPEFPETSFAWGTDNDTFGLDNVFAYEAASQEGGYVLGILAANLTETGTVGVVGPIEVGDAKLFVDGFVYGVSQAGTDAEALEPIYIGSFSDVALATEAAETLIANDADVLTGTAQMVVGPIGVALENEVLWFGTQSSQDELAEDIGVAYQVYHWEVVLREILGLLEEGTLGGQSFVLTLENEGLVIQYDEDYELSEELQTLAEETIQGIIDGEIEPLPAEEEGDE